MLLFKQERAYEVRMSDWSSDACSSELPRLVPGTQSPSRLKVLPLRGGAFATGGDAIVERRRHALIPMGPGNECGDDSLGMAGTSRQPPVTLMWRETAG